MQRKQVDMLHGPLASSILVYTFPIIISSILQLMFNAADLIVVGRFCGSLSVAAVGSTGAITNLIINLFIGLSVGAGVTVSHAIGSRETEVVHRTVHTAVPLAIVSGIFLTIVGILAARPLLAMMATPDSVLGLATIYMQVFFAGMTFNMLYNFCASILRAAGDTRSPMTALISAGVLNVILNVFFVTVLDMNVAGVALATTISQGFSAIWCLWVLTRREDACRLDMRKLHFFAPQLLKMVRIGLPAGIQGAMFSISNVIIQSSINSFGDAMMSANAAVGNLEGFNYVTVNAFHQTAVNYVGQNLGARQHNRIRKIVRLCLAYAMAAGTVIGAACCIFAPQLLSVYIPDSAEAISLGTVRLLYSSAPYFLLAVMDIMNGTLRGLGASFVSMLISVLGICGFRLMWIFTVFHAPAFHTPEVLYLSYPISWAMTFVIQIIVYFRVFRKIERE